MAKLQIRIVTNLLVNEFIAELLDSFLRNSITFFRFKHNTHRISFCLLMNKESICKLIASSNNCFFGIQRHIYNNLKFVIVNFGNRKFQFSHSHSNIRVPSAPPKDYYYYAEAWHCLRPLFYRRS